jgi:hypothetical protein
LPEAVELQKTVLKYSFKAFDVKGFVEGKDSGDHHQVGRVFHAQPGSIYVSEGFYFGRHRISSLAISRLAAAFLAKVGP